MNDVGATAVPFRLSPSSAKSLSRGTQAIPVYIRMEDPDVSRRHIGSH
jgi:hypothetical protein